MFSTRYLAQPFVWSYWSTPDVLAGWVEVLWGRLVVGLSMALALWSALRYGPRSGRSRTTYVVLALCAGAVCGELLLLALRAPDAAAGPAALLGRMLRWMAVILVLLGLHWLWSSRRSEESARQAADERRRESESQLLRMRLLALQAQIEPHFLFNTLATVQRLANTRRDLGTRLLDHLIDFVRLNAEAGPGRAPWTVDQELELVRAYLGVIELRMDGRLRVSVFVANGVGQLEFPPLLLATLVENAVKHGVAPLPEGGMIDVRVACDGACLRAEVRDTGAGFVKLFGSGIGLANSRARLRTLYGAAASLRLAANEPQGVVASVCLPLGVQAAC